MTGANGTPSQQWVTTDVSRLAESVQALAVQVAENNAILRTSMDNITRRVENTEEDVEELQKADIALREELAALALTVSSTADLLRTSIKVALWALGALVTIGGIVLAWALPHIAWT
ncbi:hypothetical protein Xcel_0518 [Xylanimonas cellulosilytica DSM 15894]|uniref:Uncharacterized protein n=1 Tax=Xylanimonas cellulosilytica (strain DSM 15894 / JCM 12276 / CECT 5975 / KCTC 9989 / LMG 20990 / NBRC 107835 / XIL07) TaxID=446471 RepID=D1BW54_XYLCX|nr:hypothetical protein [Xylanimonas cellulosilytica]ACZ29557.1 hypothetical protein Xcel_0518 [Xylanimonas cellulosilytica DSM 15894]